MKTPNDYLRKTLGDRFDEFKQKSTYFHDIVEAIELVQQDVKIKRLEKASIKAMQGLLSNPDYAIKIDKSVIAIDSIEYAKELLKQLDEETKTTAKKPG